LEIFIKKNYFKKLSKFTFKKYVDRKLPSKSLVVKYVLIYFPQGDSSSNGCKLNDLSSSFHNLKNSGENIIFLLINLSIKLTISYLLSYNLLLIKTLLIIKFSVSNSVKSI
jgi:hypothetical protein